MNVYKKKTRGLETLDIAELRAKARVSSQVHGLVGWLRYSNGAYQEVRFDRFFMEFVIPEVFVKNKNARSAENQRNYPYFSHRNLSLRFLRHMHSW